MKASFVDESYLPNVKAWSEYYRAKVGFRNYWYAACLSTEIADGDWLARTILGEDILFRRINGKVYAMGGRLPFNKTVATNEVYDPATNTWTMLAPRLLRN